MSNKHHFYLEAEDGPAPKAVSVARLLVLMKYAELKKLAQAIELQRGSVFDKKLGETKPVRSAKRVTPEMLLEAAEILT